MIVHNSAIARRNLRGAVLAVSACVFVPLSLLVPLATGPSQRIAVGSMLLGFAGILSAVTVSGGNNLRTQLAKGNLAPAVALYFSMSYGFLSLFWMERQRGIQSVVKLRSIVPALEVAGVGLAAWTVGVMLAPRLVTQTCSSMYRTLLGRRPGAPTEGAALILLGVGMLGTALQVLKGSLGYAQDASLAVRESGPFDHILGSVGFLTTYAVFWATLAVTRRRTGYSWLVWFTCLLVAAGVGLLSGVKENLAILGIAVAFGYSAAAKRFSFKNTFAPIIIFYLVVVPLVGNYRSLINTSNGRLPPIEAARVLTASLFSGPSTSRRVSSSETQDGFLHRSSRIGDVAIILQKTPRKIPFRDPSELLLAPFNSFIPRAVWPGKPVVVAGYKFSQEYYGLPKEVYTASAVTPYGDLYRHGGWIVVVIGSILLGMLTKTIDELTDIWSDPRGAFIILSIFGFFVKQESDVASLLSELPSGILISVIASRLVGGLTGSLLWVRRERVRGGRS